MKAIQSALINLPNVNINGNPTITSDLVASGFSADNYLTIPYSYVDINVYDTLEVVVCITTGNDITGDQPFAQAAPYIDMSIYNGDLSFWVFGDSTHNTITTASPNTKYWIKEEVLRGSSRYSKTYSYSTDGINYSETTSKLETSTETVSLFTLGVTNWFGAFFAGAIDLSECYIKVNNNIVWRGVKQGRKIKAVYTPSKTYREWHTVGKPYYCYTLNDTPNVGDVVYGYNSSTDTMTPTDTVKGYYPNMQMYGWGSGGQLYTPTQTPQIGDYAFISPEIIYDLNRESFTIIDVGDNYITIDDVTPLTHQRNTSYDEASLYDYILINNNNFYFKYSNQKTTKPKYKLINQ